MKKIKIIAIDDDESYLESLKHFFYRFKERYDFPDANRMSKFQDEYNIEYMLEKVNDVQPDVVLMDFSFALAHKPDDYGIELVKRIRAKFPDQRIIMLVGDDDDEDEIRWDKIKRSFEAGAAAYLGKKEITYCMEAIDEVVKGDNYVAENTMNAIIKGLKGNGESKYTLTRRQREVIQLLSMDFSIAETAAQLEGEDKKPVTPHVVNFHLQNIRRRLNSRTLHGTIAKAIREKII